MNVDNLYEHADGGLYCLLTPEAPMKHPDSGDWISGVIYTGVDGLLRSTSRARWDERFSPVADYRDDDPLVLSMIRRSNPGNTDFDFVRVFEAWHESEVSITAELLHMVIAATAVRFAFRDDIGEPNVLEWDKSEGDPGKLQAVSVTIATADLQRVLQEYDITSEPKPRAYTIRVSRK